VTAKLLLADDSVTIQRVIELTFADENVQVVAVGDGKEAIERVQADRPDIVLADIGMPERDGYEVAAFIKGRPDLAHIPVLLLTGAFEPIDEARARSVGCEGILVKPFEPQMVISRVRELLNRAAAPAAKGAASPPAAAQAGAKSEALEDYFDRLDAALSTLSSTPPPLEPVSPGADTASEPVQRPQDAAPPARLAARPAAVAESSVATGPTVPLHEAFAALLAAEKGQPIHPTGPTRESITEDVVEEVVRRVLARMGDETMRRAVLDSAERLVREEIENIKRASG
jgi:CheY-like chemotaxis protein